jgi:3-oxoacyl-[acyl-carrier protein] reductase
MDITVDLEGKTALVTGAARGIGQKVAEGIAKAGACVFAVDILESIRSAPDGLEKRWEGFRADVSDYASVREMVNRCAQRFGPPDILINVAAISTPCAIQDMTLENWKQNLDINLSSVFLCSHAVLPPMMEKRDGCIISFSSVIAETGGNVNAHYAAAKGGIEAFSRSLAREVGAYGIRVNVIAPGMVDTKMLELMGSEQREKLVRRIPLQRIGHPEDMVGPVLLLISRAGSYITGQIIRVNGGLSMS